MKLGFIGTGKIASSVITGICKSSIKYNKIYISLRNKKISKQLKKKFKKIDIEKDNQKSIKHRKKFEYSRKQITSKIKKGDYL